MRTVQHAGTGALHGYKVHSDWSQSAPEICALSARIAFVPFDTLLIIARHPTTWYTHFLVPRISRLYMFSYRRLIAYSPRPPQESISVYVFV